MHILQKLGEIFGGLIFSLAFGFLIVFIALANFTQYTTLQPMITNMIETQLTKDVTQNQLDMLYLNLTEQCKTSSTAIVPMGNNTQVDLKCDDIKSSAATDIPHVIAQNLFNQTYYKKYDCSFIDCIRGISLNKEAIVENQNSQVILSAKANEFFTKNQIFLIGAIAIGIVLIIASVRVWYNILKIIGITLLLVGITYLFIPTIKTQISKMAEGQNISPIVDSLFAPIMQLLQISLVLGIVFTITGYVTSYLMKNPEKKKN
jgi:uncharacterized membrane protein HdeD (DUF308 family)